MVSPTQSQQVTQTEPNGRAPANLGDILERVLDRGIVVVGDIRVSLLDIELLTIKLRLLIASVDTAKELGIDWWEHDPWLSSRAETPINRQSHRQLGTGESGSDASALPLSAGEKEAAND